jgi:hypothetical protein
MRLENLSQLWQESVSATQTALTRPDTYAQLGIILLTYAIAFFVASRVRRYAPILDDEHTTDDSHPLRRFFTNCGNLMFPLTAILLLRIAVEVSTTLLDQAWLVRTALTVAMLQFFISVVNDFVASILTRRAFKFVGIPLLLLHLLGGLDDLIGILSSISISVGNIDVSAYGIGRVAIFGSLLFWIGRVSNRAGREILTRQTALHESTREVASKLLEVATFSSSSCCCSTSWAST